MLPILKVINTLKQRLSLENITTVLDLGCGSFYGHDHALYKERDILTTVFNNKIITGVDIFEEDIIWRNRYGPKGNYILMDILDFDIKESYDVILCHHTLEHLTQEQHDIIFDKIEKADYRYSILGGPVGYSSNEAFEESTGNIYQKHKIGLQPDFYKENGYEVNIFDYAFVAIKEIK